MIKFLKENGKTVVLSTLLFIVFAMFIFMVVSSFPNWSTQLFKIDKEKNPKPEMIKITPIIKTSTRLIYRFVDDELEIVCYVGHKAMSCLHLDNNLEREIEDEHN